MSDEQTGDRWGDPINQERQAELKALADKQREWVAQPEATRGDSVFVHVELTGADVSWLVEESKRGLTGTAPNLHLEGADLREAHLEGASLSEAHLEGANLRWAQLAEATLRETHLEEANLWEAHLEGTVLSDAHLEGANLFEAHLQGADLRQAHP